MRKQLTAVHVVLASFFLPIGVMFLVTGALYTVAIRGSFTESVREVVLTEPLPAELSGLVAVAERELAAAGKSAPTGSASVRGGGLEWTGANREVSLKAGAEPLRAQLTIRDSTPYRRLVQLHKAKGSNVAKAISIAWAVGLLGMFVTGVMMAWGAPAWRKLALVSGAAGLATFALYVVIG